jgi:hypothetical protein
MKRIFSVPNTIYLFAFVISTAIAPFYIAGGMNMLLIGLMCISPVVFIRYYGLYKFDIPILFFLASIFIIPYFSHPESFRLSTVCYTVLFCLFYLAFLRLLNTNKFTIDNYLKLLRFLLYAYGAMLVIQHLCVLAGLPVINGIIADFEDNPFKVNSLALEPSHSARLVGLFMFCYISMKELVTGSKYEFKQNFQEDKYVWLFFLYTVLTMGSALAFLFLFLILSLFIRFKTLIPLILLGVIVFIGISYLENNAFDRMYRVSVATLTFDSNTIRGEDDSASYRIVPFIELFKKMDMQTWDFWTGKGIDWVANHFDSILPGAPEGLSGGGMMQVITEYGFVVFCLFMWISFQNSLRKRDYVGFLFWFFVVFMGGINMYTTWTFIILLSVNKYFFRKEKHHRNARDT